LYDPRPNVARTTRRGRHGGKVLSTDTLIAEFQTITGLTPDPTPDYDAQFRPFVEFLKNRKLLPLAERRSRFLAHVNWKFRLNAEPLRLFYREAASQRITFNYHQKNQVQETFDLGDFDTFRMVLREREIPAVVREKLEGLFSPVSSETTVEYLRRECETPSKLRDYSKLRKQKGNEGVARDIVLAQFSAFLFSSLPTREIHAYFDPEGTADYRESFWDELHRRAHHLFNREQALHVLHLGDNILTAEMAYDALRDLVCAIVRRSYADLNNYGLLAVVLPPLQLAARDVQTQLASDIVLFAEKHLASRLKKGYFQPARIRAATEQYITDLSPAADFDLANEGFTYRDWFVIQSTTEPSSTDRPTALLLFQKNHRDETVVPCPTCRSANVQGNSYPTLGVRSWECNNLLCPDRSKYNRGKRYSFRGLLMQQAIDDPQNEIPRQSVRSWSRDVQEPRSLEAILEMLVRHYSLHGDAVHLFNWPDAKRSLFGRRLHCHPISAGPEANSFWKSALFQRYVVDRKSQVTSEIRNLGDTEFRVLLGDSFNVLQSLRTATFDGAVTSPPYYNAREYSQWPNIYCYLYDMYNINREVYRTLKPGALYLYNIFDYFDNEHSLASSAMGQKRMILSAYTTDLFRRIGFECVGNVVWDKGDIEGKRGFNAGNFSPYYQAPFNCWEHILVFQKPGGRSGRSSGKVAALPAVLRERAVFKIVGGENVHGHSAPYPDAIPELLIKMLKPGQVVLDPFAGSLTTGRVARRSGVRAVCIERNEDYCKLGLRMYEDELSASAGAVGACPSQLALF
jgi:DNA modification methylase